MIQIWLFLLTVLWHGRQIEWMSRLDFLWQWQAYTEKQEMEALQQSNRVKLKIIKKMCKKFQSLLFHALISVEFLFISENSI